MEHYRSITYHFGTFRKLSVAEALQGSGALQTIMEHCRTLQDVTQVLQIVTECYRSIMEPLWNVTELLKKILILPIAN